MSLNLSVALVLAAWLLPALLCWRILIRAARNGMPWRTSLPFALLALLPWVNLVLLFVVLLVNEDE